MSREVLTDEELLAYAEERLVADRAAEVERQLRASSQLGQRLAALLIQADLGDQSLGALWRRGRWSCPSRAIWAASLAGRLGDGLNQYLEFHLRIVGCRLCDASVRDLQASDPGRDERARKIFESSAGALRRPK